MYKYKNNFPEKYRGFVLDDRELITPGLSYFEKYDLTDYIEYKTSEARGKNYGEITPEIGNLITSKVKSEQIPKYLLYDIYNKFYCHHKELEFKKPTKYNKPIFNFLTRKLNTYYTKGITELNPLASAIFTQETIYVIAKKIEEEQQMGNSGSTEEIMNKVLNGMSDGDAAKMMDEVSDAANKEIETMENLQKELGGNEGNSPGGNSAGKNGAPPTLGELKDLDSLFKQLKNVKFGNKQLANFIKDSLKFSTSYFSSVHTDVEESLFDADDADTLDGLENLVPALRRLNLDDIITYRREYKMKFDVYVDISGSMSGNQLTQAKVVALKFMKLSLVNGIYIFNNYLKGPLSKIKFANCRVQGGTSIQSAVIDNITKTNNPSVVITDACDRVQTHTEKAYFIGVPGASFNSGSGWNNYLNNNQCALMQKDGTLKKVKPDIKQEQYEY